MSATGQRIAALALLLALALAGGLGVQRPLARLQTARATARSETPPRGLPVEALPGRGPPATRLSALVRARAAAAGVVLDRIAPVPAPTPLAAVEIAAAGQEPALLRLVAVLEGGRPALRFAAVRLTAPAEVGLPMRIEGRIVGWAEKTR